MKTKRIVTLLVCFAMILGLFAGCGAKDSGSETHEVEKIVYATWTINTLPSNEAIQSVEDEINKISRE